MITFKHFRIALLIFLFIISIYGASYYDGNFYLFILFSIISHWLLFNGFTNNAIYFDTFIGLFFWLGYWLKTTIRIIFADGKFNQSTGYFDYSPNAFDMALLVSICGMLSLICASYIRRSFIFQYPFVIANPSGMKLYHIYINNRLKILFIFLSAIIFIGASNMYLSIYQRGEIPNTILPFGLNGIYKWLLQFGLATVSATILYFELFKNKSTSYIVSFIAVFETFISNISLLSRGMILNAFAIMLGMAKTVNSYKIKIKRYYLISMVFTVILLFVISVFVVNHIRQSNAEETKTISSNVIQNVILNNSAIRLKILFIDRWVGIEGVMAISSFPNKSWHLFNEAINEKFSYKKNSFYDENIIISPYLDLDKSKQHYVSLPGIVGFFFYPGSFYFLFLSIFIIGIAAGCLEKFIYYFGGNNIILCALLSEVIAYRLVHFGYVPSQSYLLFGALLLNVALITGIEKLLHIRKLEKVLRIK